MKDKLYLTIQIVITILIAPLAVALFIKYIQLAGALFFGNNWWLK